MCEPDHTQNLVAKSVVTVSTGLGSSPRAGVKQLHASCLTLGELLISGFLGFLLLVCFIFF